MTGRRGWDAYWFRPAASVNLAIVRIILVGVQLGFLIAMDPLEQLRTFAARPDFLYDPLPVLHVLGWPFSDNFRASFGVLAAIYSAGLASGVLGLIGLRTNLTLSIFAITCVFLQAYEYSFGDFHHPEAAMLIALSILAVSPCGKVLSVDDLVQRVRRAKRRGQFESVPSILTVRDTFARWPLLLIQWVMALVYLSATISKLVNGGLAWLNGHTLQYYMLRDAERWGVELGIWLGQHHTVLLLLSWFTILFEGTFFLALFSSRLRRIYIPLGVALHTGIYLTMAAPFFQYFALYTVFVPWARLLQSFQRRSAQHERPVVLYDGTCGLCIRSMTIARAADWFDRLTFRDLESEWPAMKSRHPELSLAACRREMHFFHTDGSIATGFFAFLEIARLAPPLWPLGWLAGLPPARAFGPRVYAWVAARRHRLHTCATGVCATAREPGQA